MDIKNTPEYKKFIRKIRVTGTRLAMMSFLYWTLIGIFTASIIGILYVIVDKIFYPVPVTEMIVLPVLVGIVLGFGVFGLIKKFPTLLATSVRIDDFLKSNERVSSAFLVDGDTKFEQALIYDSMLTLKDSRISGMLKKDFRKISAFASSSLVLAVLLLLILPTIHYFVKDAEKSNIVGGSFVDAVRVLKHSEKEWQRFKENNEVMEEASQLLEEYEALKKRMEVAKAQTEKERNPRKMKELVSEMSSLRDKIEKAKKELQKLQKDVANMKKANEGKTDDEEGKSETEKKMDELEKELSEGNFENFSDKMQNLLDEIKNSEDAENLKDELAKKLSELAQNFSNEKMQELLEQLSNSLDGLNPNELSNDQLQELLDSAKEMDDMLKQMNNQELLEMLENQLQLAQDKMTGG